MQIVYNAQFAWNAKSCFMEKIRKNISKYCLLKTLPRVLSVKNASMQEASNQFLSKLSP